MPKRKQAKMKTQNPKIIIGDGTLSKVEENRMALLIILRLGERNIAEGKVLPLDVAMKRIRGRLRRQRKKELRR